MPAVCIAPVWLISRPVLLPFGVINDVDNDDDDKLIPFLLRADGRKAFSRICFGSLAFHLEDVLLRSECLILATRLQRLRRINTAPNDACCTVIAFASVADKQTLHQ